MTVEWGQKRGVAKGSRRKFSRFAGQLQLLSRVSVQWFEKENRDLVRIETAELIEPLGRRFEDLEGILHASYMAEHMVKFTQENEDSELFSRLLGSTIDAVREGVPRDLALRYFEVWVLRIAGIFPVPRECPECGRGLLGAGAALPRNGDSIVCGECAGGFPALLVGEGALDFIQRSGSHSLLDLSGARPGPAVLARVEEICRQVRCGFLDHDLRSYDVMKATLGEAL